MNAIVLGGPGGPEALRYEQIERPVPRRGEVLVRVKAVSVNHLDLWIRSGLAAYGTKYPHILGCDFSGEVFEVAPDVKDFKPGDRIVADPGIRCLKCDYCLEGNNNLCRRMGIIGASCWGGYAEFARVSADNLVPLLPHVSFEEGAAFPLTFLTAWHMLSSRAALKAGETVLIIAGGSGIGVAAVQIAKLFGGTVIATAGGAEKTSRLIGLGADHVIDHRKEDIGRRVMEITAGQGVEVVFEHVGPATFASSLSSLKKGGRLVTCGATTGPEVTFDLRGLFSRQIDIKGSFLGTRRELLTVCDLVARGKLKPVIDEVLPLEEAARAHGKMEKSAHFGKIVLVP
ncbi:MAG: zinc-binding dehydrogenase [Nitrospiraceae bacterium]|nr:zinc-binding dehydrogenase [Nitrospiraceae bacterium]